jgi:C-terminal processing protease CtpA/Prc
VRGDDILEKVGDRSVHGLATWEVESLLSGPTGGHVTLHVAREGSKPRRRTFDVVRRSWTPDRPALSRVEGESVLKISCFAPGTAAEVAHLLSGLDKTRSLVIDLRENATGSFDEAARTAALFVSAGPLAELTGRHVAAKSFRAEPDQRIHESRLVVLADSTTAGAAELFASALRDGLARDSKDAGPKDASAKDAHAAKKDPGTRIVGEPTTGMAFSTQVVRLASGGALKLAVAKVRTLGGKALSPKGLEPDDRVFSMPEDGEHHSGADALLKRGLKLVAEMNAPPRAGA